MGGLTTGTLEAIVGWASMLSPAHDAVAHARAVEEIDRNAKLLIELLRHRPV